MSNILGNITNFANKLGGALQDVQFKNLAVDNPALYAEVEQSRQLGNLRRLELEQRQAERTFAMNELKRKQALELQRQQALGSLAPQFAQRFGIPQEQINALISAGVDAPALGSLGKSLETPKESLVEIYDANSGQMIRVPQSRAVGLPSRAPEKENVELVETYDPATGTMTYTPKNAAVGKISKVPEGQKPKEYKQFELESAGYASRMAGALDIMRGVEGKEGFNPVSATVSAAESTPLIGGVLGRAASSPDLQLYKNAAQDWVRAKLRKESGAVIGEDEMKKEYETYFPVLGDKPEVIEQKRKLRERATKAMVNSSQGAYSNIYGSSPSEVIPTGQSINNNVFNSVQEAEAANLPKGTQITINGRRAVVE